MSQVIDYKPFLLLGGTTENNEKMWIIFSIGGGRCICVGLSTMACRVELNQLFLKIFHFFDDNIWSGDGKCVEVTKIQQIKKYSFFCVTQKLTMFRKPVSLKKWNKIFSIITANKTLSPNWIVLEGYIQARKFIFVLDFRTFVIDFFVWRIFQKKLLEIFSNYIIRYNRPPTRSPSGYYTS